MVELDRRTFLGGTAAAIAAALGFSTPEALPEPNVVVPEPIKKIGVHQESFTGDEMLMITHTLPPGETKIVKLPINMDSVMAFALQANHTSENRPPYLVMCAVRAIDERGKTLDVIHLRPNTPIVMTQLEKMPFYGVVEKWELTAYEHETRIDLRLMCDSMKRFIGYDGNQ